MTRNGIAGIADMNKAICRWWWCGRSREEWSLGFLAWISIVDEISYHFESTNFGVSDEIPNSREAWHPAAAQQGIWAEALKVCDPTSCDRQEPWAKDANSQSSGENEGSSGVTRRLAATTSTLAVSIRYRLAGVDSLESSIMNRHSLCHP